MLMNKMLWLCRCVETSAVAVYSLTSLFCKTFVYVSVTPKRIATVHKSRPPCLLLIGLPTYNDKYYIAL